MHGTINIGRQQSRYRFRLRASHQGVLHTFGIPCNTKALRNGEHMPTGATQWQRAKRADLWTR
eukprot:13288461-Alexandrium_andersonii.AAC.1